MLGNWLLQNHGRLGEALRHFDIALKSKKQRPLIREMQLGGLISNDTPGVRTELVRISNQMRINSQPLGEWFKHRILSNYSPVNTHNELTETLSALPPEDAWATFLWLDDQQRTGEELEEQRIQHEFIKASIAESAGKGDDALISFRTLQSELKQKAYNGRLGKPC